MPVCGPSLSICGLLLSVWGIIQLGLMGVFFYIHSVAFQEDIVAELDDDIEDPTERIEVFYKKVDDAFTQSAINCWIAAALYVILLLISAQQFRANMRLK